MSPSPILKLVYRVLMLLYPPGFRKRHRHVLMEAFCVQRGDARYGRGIRGSCRFWKDVALDLLHSATQSWMRALNELRRDREPSSGRTADYWLKETRYAARALLARPAFTLTAGATLALGIGLTTAMFSIVYGVLIKPLPYPEPDRIVRLWDSHEKVPFFSVTVSNFFDWREESKSFAAIGAYRETGLNLMVNGEPERRPGALVTAGLLPVLGVAPEHGRFFLEEEDQPGAEPVVILTYGLWHKLFAGRADILGETLTIGGGAVTIVGVLPAHFRFPQQPNVELLLPYRLSEKQGGRVAHFLRVLGRLQDGASLGVAKAELQTVASRLAQQYPDTNAGWTVAVLPLHQAVGGDVGPALRLLLIAVGLVLLICCVNVANLFLARTSARTEELALRSALGASWGRLLSQLLVESLVLALIGALGAIAIAHAVTTLLPRLLPASMPRQQDISLDLGVLAFSLVLATVSGLLSGVIPAMRGASGALAASARGNRATTRLPRFFIASEVALALTLLVGSAVLLRSFAELSRVDPGFDVSSALAMDVTPVSASYSDHVARGRLFRELVSGLEALPVVRSAAIVHRLPLNGNSGLSVFVEGRTYDSEVVPNVNYRTVSNRYFDTLGIALLRGRTFTEDETWESGGVVVINQTMAETLWPDGDAIGSRLSPRIEGPWAEVVGIVSDARESGLDKDPEAAMYFPHAFLPVPSMTLVLRSSGARPEGLVPAVRDVFSRVDPGQPVSNFRTLAMHLERELGAPRFRTLLVSLFAFASLTLAAVGIHGVTTIAVRQRTREIGIRMALGARAGDVVRMVVEQGLTPVLFGLAGGLLGAFMLVNALEGLVYGVSPADPLSFIVLPVLLFGVAVAASLLPARRAARIDPADTLRTE